MNAGIFARGNKATIRKLKKLRIAAQKEKAPRNSQPRIPTHGERNSQKIMGAVSLYGVKFVYRHQTEYFNAQSYIGFLETKLLSSYYKAKQRIYLIIDNASCHKKPEVWDYMSRNRNKI